MSSDLSIGGTFELVCVDKDGGLQWTAYADNMVVNVGLQYALDVIFKGSAATQIDPWYIGLMNATPTVASANTASVHAGWTEFTNYTASTRQVFVDVRASQTVSNSASAASFVISTAGTVGGAFLQSTTTGSGGTLLCGAALTGSNRTVVADDTVTLTYTFSGSSS